MSREPAELRLPPDGARIWRYLDFTKFVALLLTGKLHFTRADRFLDPAEASIPRADRPGARQWAAEQLKDGVLSREGIIRYLAAVKQMPQASIAAMDEDGLVLRFLQAANSALFVNSWHVNDSESAAMWDTYLGSGPGVAIESSVGRLRAELQASPEGATVVMGAVQYLDYERDSWGPYDPYYPVFHKRRSFDHERELRAVTVRPNFAQLTGDDVEETVRRHGAGLDVPIDLNRLISRVWISPKSEPWFDNLVTALLTRFDSALETVRSSLYDAPDFT